MNAQETTEIRDLTSAELDKVSGASAGCCELQILPGPWFRTKHTRSPVDTAAVEAAVFAGTVAAGGVVPYLP